MREAVSVGEKSMVVGHVIVGSVGLAFGLRLLWDREERNVVGL